MIKKILKSIYNKLILVYRMNVTKTVYLNFKMFPISKALKLPIVLYGKVDIWDITGKIELPEKVFFNMIKIGYKWVDLWPSSYLTSQIQIVGKLIFKGEALFSGGVCLNIQSKEAIMYIGDKVIIGGGTVVKALKNIEIGDVTRITGNCIIMDSNMHYVKNINSGMIKNIMAPITIGKNCWINAGSIITKGTVMPDYSIAARNSYLCKDYSCAGANLFLVGSPAKAKEVKVQRLFSGKTQMELFNIFKKQNIDELFFEIGISEDTEGIECF